jgi:shikimate kinase
MLYFFIGYMGSGKSSLVKKLSKRSGIPYIDTDLEISKKFNKAVKDIFKDHGEALFREAESSLLRSLNPDDDLLVSTGGGLPCFNDNMQLILDKGRSFYLDVPIDKLLDRLLSSPNERPLLAGKSREEAKQFIEMHLSEREKYYRKANHILNANQPFDRLTEEVFMLLNA